MCSKIYMKAQVTTVITKHREIFFVAKIKFYEFLKCRKTLR